MIEREASCDRQGCTVFFTKLDDEYDQFLNEPEKILACKFHRAMDNPGNPKPGMFFLHK